MSNALNRIYAWEADGQWHLSRFPRADNQPKVSFATKDEASREIHRRSDQNTRIVWES